MDSLNSSISYLNTEKEIKREIQFHKSNFNIAKQQWAQKRTLEINIDGLSQMKPQSYVQRNTVRQRRLIKLDKLDQSDFSNNTSRQMALVNSSFNAANLKLRTSTTNHANRSFYPGITQATPGGSGYSSKGFNSIIGASAQTVHSSRNPPGGLQIQPQFNPLTASQGSSGHGPGPGIPTNTRYRNPIDTQSFLIQQVGEERLREQARKYPKQYTEMPPAPFTNRSLKFEMDSHEPPETSSLAGGGGLTSTKRTSESMRDLQQTGEDGLRQSYYYDSGPPIVADTPAVFHKQLYLKPGTQKK